MIVAADPDDVVVDRNPSVVGRVEGAAAGAVAERWHHLLSCFVCRPSSHLTEPRPAARNHRQRGYDECYSLRQTMLADLQTVECSRKMRFFGVCSRSSEPSRKVKNCLWASTPPIAFDKPLPTISTSHRSFSCF